MEKEIKVGYVSDGKFFQRVRGNHGELKIKSRLAIDGNSPVFVLKIEVCGEYHTARVYSLQDVILAIGNPDQVYYARNERYIVGLYTKVSKDMYTEIQSKLG